MAVERFERGLQLGGQARAGPDPRALPRPFLGIFARMFSHRLRNLGISPPGMLSATGTRGSLTMPHSMASMSEKSLIVQGNNVPSAYPDPRRKNGVADRSIICGTPSLRFTVSEAGNPEPRGFVVLLGFLPVVTVKVVVLVLARFLAIAVVRLVVERPGHFHAHQLGHHALEHLAFGFQSAEGFRRAPAAETARPSRVPGVRAT